MRKQILQKIKQTTAFTLSETLLTVLIMSIIFTAVSGGVVVMRNNYANVVMKAQAQTLLATAVAAVTGDLESATIVKSDGAVPADPGETGKVAYFYCGRRNMYMKYTPETGPGKSSIDNLGSSNAPTESITVNALNADGNALKNDAGNKITFNLLSEATDKKQNLETVISGIAYTINTDGEIQYFTVTIGVYCTASAFQETLERREVKIRPYNKITPTA